MDGTSGLFHPRKTEQYQTPQLDWDDLCMAAAMSNESHADPGCRNLLPKRQFWERSHTWVTTSLWTSASEQGKLLQRNGGPWLLWLLTSMVFCRISKGIQQWKDAKRENEILAEFLPDTDSEDCSLVKSSQKPVGQVPLWFCFTDGKTEAQKRAQWLA